MKKVLPVLVLAFLVSSSFDDSLNQNHSQNPCKKNNQYLLQSVLWFQRSGEMQALYFQGYNVAKYSLDNYLKQSKSKMKKAVIVDIDETIFNNSPYEGRLLHTDSSYSKDSWQQWVSTSSAEPLPGAVDFLNYAKSKGAEVFYISNRGTSEINATLKNLQKFNFPFSDEKHLVFKADKNSSKELRRKEVAKNYDIALLCGDNLADFDAAFDFREEKLINDSVAKHRYDFGSRFIVLPNPMYGDWEKPIYGSGTFTNEQRDSLRRANIIAY